MPWQDFSNPASFFFWLVRFNVHISRFHELQHRMVNGPADGLRRQLFLLSLSCPFSPSRFRMGEK